MSFLDHLIKEAEERSAKYAMYREYYDGQHDAQITPRQRAYLELKPGQEFSANYMHIVVDSLANRLVVETVECDSQDDVMRWWKDSSMNSGQEGLMVMAIRDGDGFLMVDWDAERQQPRFIPHGAYDGRDGVQIHYSGDSLRPVAVTKRWWIEFGPGAGKYRRMNVYMPDKIHRLVAGRGTGDFGWADYTDDGLPAVLDWTDETGEPLGIPFFHFANRSNGQFYGISELEPGIPMQNALNKSIIDLLAAADASGFRMMVMLGDDAGQVKVSPGGFINSLKKPDEVEVSAIPGEPMRPLIEVVDSFVQRIGQVTNTPLSYFQTSGQMASEGTHQQHESRMLDKARMAARGFSDPYRAAVRMALKLDNTFGSGSHKEDQDIEIEWADFDVREEVEKINAKADALKKLVEAGASIEQAALVVGFSEQQASMLAKVDENAVEQARLEAMMLRSRMATNEAIPTEEVPGR